MKPSYKKLVSKIDQTWQVTVGVEFGSRTVDVNGCGSQESSGFGRWLVAGWWCKYAKSGFFLQCKHAFRSRIKLQCWDTAGQDWAATMG